MQHVTHAMSSHMSSYDMSHLLRVILTQNWTQQQKGLGEGLETVFSFHIHTCEMSWVSKSWLSDVDSCKNNDQWFGWFEWFANAQPSAALGIKPANWLSRDLLSSFEWWMLQWWLRCGWCEFISTRFLSTLSRNKFRFLQLRSQTQIQSFPKFPKRKLAWVQVQRTLSLKPLLKKRRRRLRSLWWSWFRRAVSKRSQPFRRLKAKVGVNFHYAKSSMGGGAKYMAGRVWSERFQFVSFHCSLFVLLGLITRAAVGWVFANRLMIWICLPCCVFAAICGFEAL